MLIESKSYCNMQGKPQISRHVNALSAVQLSAEGPFGVPGDHGILCRKQFTGDQTNRLYASNREQGRRYFAFSQPL